MTGGTDWRDTYSREELHSALSRHIRSLISNEKVHPAPERRAVLLGGQSGAGKTKLHNIFREELEHNAIVINGDEYRKSHPHFAELSAKYGKEAVSHTAGWAGAMTEALIDALSGQGYDLIIEGTLRTSEVPTKTAALLISRDYDVSLALMAVKPEISLLSCQIRYEMMRRAGTEPRATDPTHHDKVVHDIVGNLAELEQSELFSGVRLYDRAGRCLFPSSGEGDARLASEVLRDVLFGEWIEEERAHYEHLQDVLADLKKR